VTRSPVAAAFLELRDLRDEVHVWTSELCKDLSPEDIERFESWLSSEETARYQRYLRSQDRNLFLVAHALLRHTLSRYAEAAPAAWRFETGEHGRPEIVGPLAKLGLRFNISHSPGLVAVLISDGIDAGVDVELPGRVADPAAVARSVFSEAEVRALEGLEPDEFQTRFYELWTLGEAYIKARGLGLEIPLREFTFSVGQDFGVRIEFDASIQDDAAQWQFHLWRPGERHQGAVALRRGAGQNRRLVFYQGFAAGTDNSS
jgi:4'-phosphopantetheinyl transferase